MSFKGMADRAVGVLTRRFRSEGEDGEGNVRYLPAIGESYLINGIFDDQHAYSDPGTGVKVSSVNPTCGVLASEFRAAPKRTDQLDVAGVRYKILEAKPDGVAGWVLDLELVKV